MAWNYNAAEQRFKDVGLDPRGGNESATALQRLVPSEYQRAQSRSDFNRDTEGSYQTTLKNLIARVSNRNYGQLGQKARMGAQSAVNQGFADAGLRNQSEGLGAGYQAGANTGMSLMASRAGNTAAGQYTDPNRQDADLSSLIQLLTQQLGQNPGMESLGSIFSPVEAANQRNEANRKSSGLGGILGQLAGAYASSYAGSQGAKQGGR
jgi:hypothetical protein